MSIFINGMQLPKDEVAVIIYSDGEVRTGDWTKYSSIEVPPHGRLIDADALLADVRAHSESYFADDFAHEWVDVAPTVIDAESYSERELQRDYEASVEYAQHCERYEPTYDPDTGAM